MTGFVQIVGFSALSGPRRRRERFLFPRRKHEAGHQPQLVRLRDGRYAVRCEGCERGKYTSVPIWIGVPITNQFEAEAILHNHGGRAA